MVGAGVVVVVVRRFRILRNRLRMFLLMATGRRVVEVVARLGTNRDRVRNRRDREEDREVEEEDREVEEEDREVEEEDREGVVL